MNRFASAAAIVMSLVLSTSAFAQSKAAAAPNKPATPPPTTPTAKAKWVVPVKGTVYVEVIKGAPKRVKDDIVTTLQIKNVSTGAIALLKVDEYWYSMYQNQFAFSHQGGKVDPKAVKSFKK